MDFIFPDSFATRVIFNLDHGKSPLWGLVHYFLDKSKGRVHQETNCLSVFMNYNYFSKAPLILSHV